MSETVAENTPKAYRRPIEPANFITYALVALLAFVGFALLLATSIILASPSIGGVAVFLFIAAAVFAFGALCHILNASSGFGAFCRKFDRCAVAVLTSAAFAHVFLFGMANDGSATHTDVIWAYSLFAIIVAATIVTAAVNIAGVREYKIISLVFYVVIGWACVARAHRIVDLHGWLCFWLLFGGGASYFVGTLICAFEGLPARHTVKHIFIMIGATLYFVGIYSYTMM